MKTVAVNGSFQIARMAFLQEVYTNSTCLAQNSIYYIDTKPDCAISVRLSVKSDQMMPGPIKNITFAGPLSANIKG